MHKRIELNLKNGYIMIERSHCTISENIFPEMYEKVQLIFPHFVIRFTTMRI